MMFTGAEIKKLVAPLAAEQALVMAVGMADVVMLSSAGEAAISGVALVDMLCYLVITILAALATGGAVIVSQYLGAGERDRAGIAAGQVILATLVVSLAVTALCLAFRRGTLALFFGSVEKSVMDAALTYFLITALSFPFVGLYSAAAALFRSQAKTTVTLYVSLLMNVVNVTGNAIGVYALHAGVAGVAVPTLISRVIAALVLCALAAGRGNPVALTAARITAFHRDYMDRILAIAVPNGIENGLFSLGRLLVTSIVALFGTAQTAANGVANSVNMIAIVCVNALNLAIVTVVGQCVGAREYGEARFWIKRFMILAYAVTGGLSALVIALLPWIVRLYALSGETARYALILVIMHDVMATALHPTSFVLANALRAAGDARFTMRAGVASMLAFRLGSALVFGVLLNLGVIGVTVAMGTDWLCRSVCFAVRYRSGKWTRFRAI